MKRLKPKHLLIGVGALLNGGVFYHYKKYKEYNDMINSDIFKLKRQFSFLVDHSTNTLLSDTQIQKMFGPKTNITSPITNISTIFERFERFVETDSKSFSVRSFIYIYQKFEQKMNFKFIIYFKECASTKRWQKKKDIIELLFVINRIDKKKYILNWIWFLAKLKGKRKKLEK